MNRREKVDRILAILDERFPSPPIPLGHRDPFTLLVAVVLSAQTTDKKVNEVTGELFAQGPTPSAMAKLGEARVRALIREVGLAPQKAKAIVALSLILDEQYGGRVPDTYDELIGLPGVGDKTASVVLSQAFGKPAFPVDTHIFRLAHRFGLSRQNTPKKVSEDLKRCFPESTWGKVHLQLIYFGRKYCPALRHDVKQCPICSWAAPRRARS